MGHIFSIKYVQVLHSTKMGSFTAVVVRGPSARTTTKQTVRVYMITSWCRAEAQGERQKGPEGPLAVERLGTSVHPVHLMIPNAERKRSALWQGFQTSAKRQFWTMTTVILPLLKILTRAVMIKVQSQLVRTSSSSCCDEKTDSRLQQKVYYRVRRRLWVRQS